MDIRGGRNVSTADLRFPDFIIIGAMKSATSTLYAWLRTQPGTFLAEPKEVNFFSFDRTWAHGPGWYSDRFSAGAQNDLLGEASVSYTYPDDAETAAERMAGLVPGARLIYVVREPVERLRSHYRHEVQRNRERRPLLEAISTPGNPYVETSRYFSCLEPYIHRFPSEQIRVIRFEDLVEGENAAWFDVLAFLDLPPAPPPGTAHNVTADNSEWSPLLRWLKEKRLWSFRKVARLPRPIRKLGHRVLMRDGEGYQAKLSRSQGTIPAELLVPIWDDVGRLERWMGTPAPMWPREDTAKVVGGTG
jgi:Sulfotransferase family